MSGDSDIKRQLSDVNTRYEDLKVRLRDRQEDINLMRLFLDRLVYVNGRLDWCIETEGRMQKLKPTSRELEPLKKEFEQYKVRTFSSIPGQCPQDYHDGPMWSNEIG